MRLWAAILFLLGFPSWAMSQSKLNYPRAFTPTELSLTGFTVANPGTASAVVTFTLYSTTGVSLMTATRRIPPTGQIALVGTDLFPAPTSTGWVQATSLATGLQGFWVGFEEDLPGISFRTALDGAEAAIPVASGIFPLVAGATELNVANPGPTSTSVDFRFYSALGTELTTAAFTRILPAHGIYRTRVSTVLPPGVDISQVSYATVVASGGEVAGTEIVREFLVPAESGVLNLVDRTTALTELVFPFMASGIDAGGGAYITAIDVVNLSSSSVDLTITLYDYDVNTGANSGASTTSPTQTIPPNGALRTTAQDLFNLSSAPGAKRDGWMRVTATGPVTGFSAIGELNNGSLALVPVQAAARNALLFTQLAESPPGPGTSGFYTGVALANPGVIDAEVDVYAVKPNGGLLGGANIPANAATAHFVIPAGGKADKEIGLNLIPEVMTQPPGEDNGYVVVISSQPLIGLELFFTRDFKLISNVASGVFAPGIPFNPPSVVAPALTLSSASPNPVTRGAVLTLEGTGFSPVASDNYVVFETLTGFVEPTAGTASPTSLSVSVPAAAISGPVQVRTLGQTSPAAIVQVAEQVGLSTRQVQSAFDVAAGETVSNADIYVPTNIAPANVTLIGVGAVSPAPSLALVGNSVPVARGATVFIIVRLSSVELQQSAGLTLSVSGGGVTVSDPSGFSRNQTLSSGSPALLQQVVVSGSAVPGPRNIILTNNNLDTTVFTGGFVIQ